MIPFTYYTPTKVVFGNEAELQAGAQLKALGASKVLLHYGSASVIRSGLLERVIQSLDEAQIPHVSLGGVVPNPRLSKVYEGIELAKRENVDFILAIGGGSVIDSSKAIALGLFDQDGDVWDFFEGKRAPQGAFPVACILTLPAAGSEMSNSCVITKEDNRLKRYTGHEDCLCKFALMNPALTKTLPKEQTVNGCVDMLMHTMERYFNNSSNLSITDEIAEGLMRSVIQSALKIVDDPNDDEARWSLMWAGSLAHNNLTSCGSNRGDWATHNIEHELSGMFDVPHGAGLSSIWSSWATYVLEMIPHRFAQFANKVLGVPADEDMLTTARNGIVAMNAFYSKIGSPISVTELLSREISEEEIEEMADKACHFGNRTLGTVLPLKKEDIANILRNAK